MGNLNSLQDEIEDYVLFKDINTQEFLLAIFDYPLIDQSQLNDDQQPIEIIEIIGEIQQFEQFQGTQNNNSVKMNQNINLDDTNMFDYSNILDKDQIGNLDEMNQNINLDVTNMLDYSNKLDEDQIENFDF